MEENTANLDEQFVFTPKAKKNSLIISGIGLVLLIIGIFIISNSSGDHGGDHHGMKEKAETMLASKNGGGEAHGSHGGEHASGDHSGGHGYSWTKRLWADIWVNNMYFLGLSIIGVFFFTIHYVSYSGWSASLRRVFESFGFYLPIAAAVTIVVFLIAQKDLFHWTHQSVYESDEIIAGKRPYLNAPFFFIRMVIYFAAWIFMAWLLRKESLKEDLDADYSHHRKLVKLSAGFLVIFAITSSTSAWDWILSIDTHWFSTMFGWYLFATWFVTGLAGLTFAILLLKDQGFLKIVNENHLHDMGKYVFAFSIFWTYIWFSQFLLIYYANIPEESVYFLERLNNPFYSFLFFFILFLNFIFPFLFLMTRESKRQNILLKVACVAVLIGHWLDFYLMISPGVTQGNGVPGIDFLFVEVGSTMLFLGVFIYAVMYGLSKAPLIPKNDPMLQESIHHHV